jgi:hypothetical protein
MRFDGCYIEQNGQAIVAKQRERYGEEWLHKKDRESAGYMANILVEAKHLGAVVFDTCYMHGLGGIWLPGPKASTAPVVFEHVQHPPVIWSERDNFEFEHPRKPKVAQQPGIFYRPEDGGYQWLPTQQR